MDTMTKNSNYGLIPELVKLLKNSTAHVGFNEAVADIPAHLLGTVPPQLPYSIWQLVEHIRIAQKDMLEFSRNSEYQELSWPDDYWPKEPTPTSKAAFNESVAQVNADLDEFIRLLKSNDPYAPIPHGEGQTLLQEALQIADHTAYHVGEIVAIRRLLGAWKS